MTFLTFLLYFISSQVIYTLLSIAVYYGYKRFIRYKFKKALQNGQIKIVTMEDLAKKVEEDDGTWH